MTRLALLLFLSTEAAAQVLPAAPRAAAMAGAAVAVTDGRFSDSNPASLHGERLLAVRAAQIFELHQLRFAEAFVAIPAFGGGAALSISGFGFEDYRETLVSLGYGRPIWAGTVRPLLAGIRLRWYSLSIDGYGSASAPSLSAGLILPVSHGLALGMAASNLYVPPGNLSEVLERSLTIGAMLRPTENFLLAMDAWKAATSPVDVRFGLEVKPLSAIALRGGFTLEPERYTAGIGLLLSRLRADLAAERHETLGWTPSIAVGVSW